MKRFLLSLVAIVITSLCFAQDIIVQKNGSTIQAKVLKVSQSEVEYKKFSNQNGPTYTISTKDLQCINYENGTKDTFVSANYNPSIVTNETATQFSNDQQLLSLYNNTRNKKAQKLKKAGWIVGGSIVGIGAVLTLLTEDVLSHDIEVLDDDLIFVGPCVAGLGIATWAALYFPGKHLENKYNSVQTTPVFQQEFNIGKNDRLMVGVDMLKDNTRRNQTLGLGVSYNF